jgi:hypothetical protein
MTNGRRMGGLVKNLHTFVRLCLLLALGAMLSAGCDRGLSSDLRIDIRTGKSVYAPNDDFSGTLAFTNKSLKQIHETFPTSCQYHIAFYDWLGIVRSYYPTVAFEVLTYLELEPLAMRVDTLSFRISYNPDMMPPGMYRVRAWVENHEDVFSETTIEVR